MVGPLLLVGGAFVAKKMGLFGKGSKSGKMLDLTKGIFGDVVLGMGAGALVNYIDGNYLGGAMQKMYVGSAQKGRNLNVTDAVVLATTVGLGGITGKNMQRSAAIIGGKKLGEFTGAIDPIDLSQVKRSVSGMSGMQAMELTH